MLALSDNIKALGGIPHGLFYVLLGVTILMNIVSFLAFYFDSKNPIELNNKATNSSLNLYTLLLGGLGALAALVILRYKNKRKHYFIIAAISIIINAVLLGLLF